MRGLTADERMCLLPGEVFGEDLPGRAAELVRLGRAILSVQIDAIDDEWESIDDVCTPTAMGELALRVCPVDE